MPVRLSGSYSYRKGARAPTAPYGRGPPAAIADSVNAKNVGEIVGQTDVDGALVGGASLKADEFATLSAIAAGGPLP